jgi:TPR repeat protein
VKFCRDMLFPESFTDAMIECARKAAAGDAESQFRMAQMYRHGKGVPMNIHEAITWYKRAFDGGFPEAAYRLGRLYTQGSVIGKDIKKALHWHSKAARADHVPAMVALGNHLARGAGIEKDLSAAATWYGKAAKSKNAGAQFVYGLMLCDGRGVAIDRIAAYVWICRAIDNDLPEENRNIAITVRQALLKSMPPDDKIRAQASIDASGNEPPEHARDGDTRRTPPAASAA